MKKILLSILTIGAVSVLGVFVTQAYFSDTETSTDNTFTTGAIDLKVDSEAHYNGLECVDGVWVNNCYVPEEAPNLLVNGDFEFPEVTASQKWQIFPNGTSGLGWTVDWVAGANSYGGATRPNPALQELHEGVNGWLAQHGNQYTELDSDWQGPTSPLNGEPALVRIYQDVVTTVGKKYQLNYYFSPRPGTSIAENELEVKVAGVTVNNHSAVGAGNTAWTMYTEEFVATSTSTLIEFVGGGTNNSLGVFLDNVSLYEKVCNSTFTELEGQVCDVSWALTDLGPQNKFFNYADVKPGDWGENTISLHVYDNDAYACMYFDGMENNDLGLTEPESDAGDATDGAGNGELSNFVNVFMWKDDGDNVYEQGEVPFGEPMLAKDAFDEKSYALFTPGTGAMSALTTQYVGIAWCAGAMMVNGDYTISCNGAPMGNQTQTDEMLVDVGFYVEQARNNPNFTCEGLLGQRVSVTPNLTGILEDPT